MLPARDVTPQVTDVRTAVGGQSMQGRGAVPVFATLGALIVRRAGNLIGWIMLGMAGASACVAPAGAYAVAGDGDVSRVAPGGQAGGRAGGG